MATMTAQQLRDLRAKLATDSARMRAEIAERAAMKLRGEIDDLPLIRRTHISEVEEETPSLPQVKGVMTVEASAAWNHWLRTGIANALAEHNASLQARFATNNETVATIFGEALGAALKQLDTKIATEVGELRAEIAVLQGITRGQVSPLEPKKASHAA